MAMLALYLVNVVQAVINMVLAYHTFIPTAVASDLRMSVLNMLSDMLIIISILIADATVLFRLHIIWLRDFRVLVIPILALIGLLGAGIAVTVLNALMIAHGQTEAYLASYQTSATVLLFLTLGLNWVVTSMIIGRLWWANRQLRTHYTQQDSMHSSSYVNVTIALVESGAFYTLVMTGYFIANWVGDGNAQYLFTNSLAIVVGLVPTCLALKRSLGFIQPTETLNDSSPSAAAQISKVEFAVYTETHTDFAPGRRRSANADREDEDDRSSYKDGLVPSGKSVAKLAIQSAS